MKNFTNEELKEIQRLLNKYKPARKSQGTIGINAIISNLSPIKSLEAIQNLNPKQTNSINLLIQYQTKIQEIDKDREIDTTKGCNFEINEINKVLNPSQLIYDNITGGGEDREIYQQIYSNNISKPKFEKLGESLNADRDNLPRTPEPQSFWRRLVNSCTSKKQIR
jgi:hypothetical protein